MKLVSGVLSVLLLSTLISCDRDTGSPAHEIAKKQPTTQDVPLVPIVKPDVKPDIDPAVDTETDDQVTFSKTYMCPHSDDEMKAITIDINLDNELGQFEVRGIVAGKIANYSLDDSYSLFDDGAMVASLDGGNLVTDVLYVYNISEDMKEFDVRAGYPGLDNIKASCVVWEE